MGILDRLTKGGKYEEIPETDYLEIEEFEAEHGGGMYVRIEKLTDFADTSHIQELVRKGDIVFVKMKPLMEKDMTELKRAVDRLRKTVHAIGGDIAGIEEDYLVVTPPGVVIHRRR